MLNVMLVWMLMEWNGFSWRSQGYERSGRLSEKRNYPFTVQHGPLSARGERQSHPLAGQAQACGHPTQVEGPGGADGTCRGQWLIPLLKKTRFVHVILAPVHAILLCVAPSENSSKLCSSLRRGRASPHRVDIVRDLQPFNHSRFVHGRQASILVLESLRSRRTECNFRSRVIPADDSHALPFFEEILESSQTQ